MKERKTKGFIKSIVEKVSIVALVLCILLTGTSSNLLMINAEEIKELRTEVLSEMKIGTNRFSYYPIDKWKHGPAAPDDFTTVDTRTDPPNFYYTFDFEGTGVELWGLKNVSHTIVTFELVGDIRTKKEVDTFANPRTGDVKLFEIKDLANGPHQIKVTATGRSNPAATGGNIEVKKAYVIEPAPTATDMTLAPSEVNLFEGSTSQITWKTIPELAKLPDDFVFVSADPSIATMSSTGLITGVKEGTTSVQGQSPMSSIYTNEITVTVKNAVEMHATIVNSGDSYQQKDYDAVLHKDVNKESLWSWKGDKATSEIAILTTSKDLQGVNVTVSDFSDGVNTITADNIDATFMKETSAFIGNSGLHTKIVDPTKLPIGPHEDFFDIIYSQDPQDIDKGRLQLLWVDLHVPENTKAGTYQGTLTIASQNSSEVSTMYYELEVIDVSFPDASEYTFRPDFWTYPLSSSDYYEVEPFSAEHIEILKTHLLQYKESGGTSITGTLVEEAWDGQTYGKDIHGVRTPSLIKWVKSFDGTWKYDYTYFDKYVALAKSIGLGDDIVLYSPLPWNNAIIYHDEKTNTMKKDAIHTGNKAQYSSYFTPFFEDFTKHLDEKGWFDDVLLGVDERPNMKVVFDVIDEVKNKDGHIFRKQGAYNSIYNGDGVDERMENLSFNLNLLRNDVPKFQTWLAKRQAKGLKTTFYTGTMISPNTFIKSKPVEGYWTMAYSSALNLDGFLDWAYDAWVQDPLRDATHFAFQAGDTFMVYPSQKDAAVKESKQSIRSEKYNEGVRDANKIKILQAEPTLKADVDALLAKVKKSYEFKTMSNQAGWCPGSSTNGADSEWITPTAKDTMIQDMAEYKDGIKELSKKYAALQKVDTSELQRRYEAYQDFPPTDYTITTWAILADAIDHAKLVLDKESPTKEEVLNAIALLHQAEAQLISIKELKIVIAAAKELKAGDYTAESFATLVSAITAAEGYFAKGTEAEIMSAKTAIEEAVSSLEAKTNMAKDILASTIDKAMSIKESSVLEGLAEKVVANFNKRLDEAVAVLSNVEASPLAMMEAWLQLAQAMHYLDFSADKTQLNALIAECDLFDLGVYQEEGKAEFKAALTNAREVAASDEVLDDSITKAFDRLISAKGNLNPIDNLNKTLLSFFIQKGEAVKAKHDHYEQDAKWDAFIQALNDANTALATAKIQKTIDDAAAILADAYEDIRLIANEDRLTEIKDFMKLVRGLLAADYRAEDYTKIQQAVEYAAALYNTGEFTKAEFAKFQTMKLETTKIAAENKIAKSTDLIKPKHHVVTGDTTNYALLWTTLLGAGMLLAGIQYRRIKTGMSKRKVARMKKINLLMGLLLFVSNIVSTSAQEPLSSNGVSPTPAGLQGNYEYYDRMSDEFNGEVRSQWLMDYMPWWSDTAKREKSGTKTRYRYIDEATNKVQENKSLQIYVNGENHMDAETFQPYYLEMLSGPKKLPVADRYVAPNYRDKNNYNSKFAGFMAGSKNYLNTFRGSESQIQSHIPYDDSGATTYGYFETRVKFMSIQSGQGIAPAFWFIGMQDGIHDSGEVDGFEILDNHTLDFTIHPKGDPRIQKVTKQFKFKEDLSADYHTYGILWDESGFSLYFDGTLLHHFNQKIDYRMIPMFSINHHENGWIGSADGKGFPDERTMDIDYYRVFKEKGKDPEPNKVIIPTMSKGNNIASAAYISLFGLTGTEVDATPMQWLNDGLRDNDVLSSLNNGKQQTATLPQYLYIDWMAPATFNTIALHAKYAKSQAPTLLDVEVSSDGEHWNKIQSDVSLVWETDSQLAESQVIILDDMQVNTKYTRLLLKEANLKQGRFGLCEVEIGQDITPMVPEYEELPAAPDLSMKDSIFAEWNMENNLNSNTNLLMRQTGAGMSYVDGPTKNGNALQFSGNKQATQTFLTAPLEQNGKRLRSDEDFTLGMWIKPDVIVAPVSDQLILFQQLGTAGGKPWLFIYNGTLGTYIDGVNRYDTNVLKAKEWQYVSLTFEKINEVTKKGRISIYVNGNLGLSQEITYLPDSQCDASAVLGIHKSKTKGYYNGGLDHVTLLNKALSPVEMKALYHVSGNVNDIEATVYNATSVIAVNDIEGVVGQIDKGDIMLPESVTTVFEKVYSKDIHVNWNAEEMNAVDVTKAGTYTISGTLQMDEITNAANPSGLKAVQKIIIKEKISTAALSAVVASINAVDPTLYTESSFAAFLSACQSEQTKETLILINKFPNYQISEVLPTSATQEVLDNMAYGLENAKKLLILKPVEPSLPDVSQLAKKLKDMETLLEGDYTNASWVIMADAIDHAKLVLDNEAATKEEVLVAIVLLDQAEVQLFSIRELKIVIAAATELKAEDYSAQSFAILVSAIAKAEGLFAQGTASEIVSAKMAIEEAVANLEAKANVAKDILTTAINKAMIIKDSGVLEGLAEKVVANFSKALNEAANVLGNAAATPEAMMEAWLELAQAMHYLDFTADKTDLNALIAECGLIELEVYQEAGKAEFIAALANAREVAASDEVLDDSITKAFDRLTSAKGNLKPIDNLDKTLLSFFIQKGEEVKAKQDYYEQDAKWDVFIQALNDAKIALATAKTQKIIDDAAALLANSYEDIRLIANEDRLTEIKDFMKMVRGLLAADYHAADYTKMQQAVTFAYKLLHAGEFTKAEFEKFQTMKLETTKIIVENKVTKSTNLTKQKHSVATGDTTNYTLLWIALLWAGILIAGMKYKKAK